MANLAIGVPQILSIVTIGLAILIFVLQIEEERHHDSIGLEDHVLVAAFGANILSFILVWFVAGSPADLGSDWIVTFSLHTFISGILHLVFLIMEAETREPKVEVEGSGNIGTTLHPQTVAAIVFTAVNAPLLLFLSGWFYLDQLLSLKDNMKRLLCFISLILTITSLTCWLVYEEESEIAHDLWFHGIIIAGSLAAALACFDGLFNKPADALNFASSFSFNALIGACLLAIYFIGAAVDIEISAQNDVLLVSIILAAINAVILFYMGYVGDAKQGVRGLDKINMLILGIALLTVLQFSIAMGVQQENHQGVAFVGSITWQHSILCLAASSVFIAIFFHFVSPDHNARGIHIFLAFVSYVVFFIADCVEASQNKTNIDDDNKDDRLAYRVRITALIAAAALCLLLGVTTVLTFPHVRDIRVAAETEAETAAEPPAGSSSESEAEA